MEKTKQIFLVLIAGFFCLPVAIGMNTDNFRRSSNIEDRRNDANGRIHLANGHINYLIRLGDQANQNAFPFFCPSFKPHREKFSQLAAELKRAKPLAQLLTPLTPQEQSAFDSAAANACEGAKLTAESSLAQAQSRLEKESSELKSQYEKAYGYSAFLHDEITRNFTTQLKNELIEQLNSDCRKVFKQTKEALGGFRDEINGMYDDLNTSASEMGYEKKRLKSLHCGDLRATAAGTSTSSNFESSVSTARKTKDGGKLNENRLLHPNGPLPR